MERPALGRQDSTDVGWMRYDSRDMDTGGHIVVPGALKCRSGPAEGWKD